MQHQVVLLWSLLTRIHKHKLLKYINRKLVKCTSWNLPSAAVSTLMFYISVQSSIIIVFLLVPQAMFVILTRRPTELLAWLMVHMYKQNVTMDECDSACWPHTEHNKTESAKTNKQQYIRWNRKNLKWMKTYVFVVFVDQLHISTISAGLLFHQLLSVSCIFLTHPHWQKSTSSHFVHLQDVEDSLTYSLRAFICAVFRRSSKWSVVRGDTKASFSREDRERRCLVKYAVDYSSSLFSSFSISRSLQAPRGNTSNALRKIIFTILNITGSPLFTHSPFSLFRSFQTSDLLHHVNRE